MIPNHVRRGLLHRAALESIGPAADKPTELLSAEQLAKVASYMRRNGHWLNQEEIVTRDEQLWLAELEQIALSRPDAPWRTVLDITGHDLTEADVQRAYRQAAMRAHPDRGGSTLRMQRLNAGRDQAFAEIAGAGAAA